MSTLNIAPGESVSYVVAGATVANNQLIVRDGLIGIVSLPTGTTGALGDVVQVQTEGIMSYGKAAVAFTFGQDVYYDATANLITTVQAGNTLVGVALGTLGVMAGAGAGLTERFKLIGSAGAMVASGGAAPFVVIADPGDAGAIPVTDSGACAMTSGALNQTRTLAIPTFDGQEIRLSMTVDGGGDIATTVAGGIDSLGNTIITMADAGDACVLLAMTVAGARVWRIMGNAGCALT